ncbi:MAG: tetratricopeptide repeat protein [Elusimicrobia bacterium]|nr:tetratricopeptide repeat protein [Elusimicrobiota bacterium]
MSPTWRFRLLKACAFFSGAAALVYEMMWTRRLTAVFGHAAFALASVSGAFMVGLAVGAVASRFVPGHVPRLRAYSRVEAAIAVAGLFSPLALAGTERVMSSLLWPLFPHGGSEPAWFPVFVVVLLLPSALMGAALPLLAEGSEKRDGFAGLYGWNLLGAASGCAAAGLFLPVILGVFGATCLAVGLSLACAGLAHALSPSIQSLSPVSDALAGPLPPSRKFRVLLASMIAFAVGALGMAGQPLWLRSVQMLLGSATQTTALLLTAVLAGSALGGLLQGRLRSKYWEAGLAAFVVFTAAQVWLFEREFFWIAKGFFLSERPLWARESGQFAACLLVAAPPAAALTWAFTALREDFEDASVDGLLAADCAGGAIGAFTGAFLLLPMMGLRTGLVALAAAAVVLSMAAFVRSPRRLAFCALAAVGLWSARSAAAWDPAVLSSGPFLYAAQYAPAKNPREFKNAVDAAAVLYHADGLSATVTVRQNQAGQRSLQLNGKTDASTGSDSLSQSLMSWLPLALRPDAGRVAVVGLGSGMTAAAAGSSSRVESLDVIEIEPRVAEASRYFDRQTHDVLSDKRVNLVFTDARHFFATRPGAYDVVIGEPSNPWFSGSAGFYTRESLAAVRERLTRDGVFALWFHAYSMDPATFKMVMATFAGVFPRVMLMRGGVTADYVLIGTAGSWRTSEADWKALLAASPALKRELVRYGVDSFDALLGGAFVLDDAEFRSFSAGAPIHTENRPALEFAAQNALYRRDDLEIYKELETARKAQWPALLPLVVGRQAQSAREGRIGAAATTFKDNVRALGLLTAAEKGLPNDPRVATDLARLLLRGGLPDEAEKRLLRIAAAHPRYAPALFHLADYYAFIRGEEERALEWARRGVRADPGDPRGAISAATLLMRRSMNAEARRVLDDALRAGRADPETRTELTARLRLLR